jgi:hypothetical protein
VAFYLDTPQNTKTTNRRLLLVLTKQVTQVRSQFSETDWPDFGLLESQPARLPLICALPLNFWLLENESQTSKIQSKTTYNPFPIIIFCQHQGKKKKTCEIGT